MKRIALACLVALTLVGCSEADTGPDEIALHYSGGPIEDQKFEECVDPGKHVFDGFGDHHYVYPIGQRTFTFTDDKNITDRDSDAITVVAAAPDLVEMKVSGSATFNFASDCDTVRKFHEQIGNKYRQQTKDQGGDAWWQAILGVYIKTNLDKALDVSAKAIPFTDLYANPDARAQMEGFVSDNAPKFIADHAKGEGFFTGFRLSLNQPYPVDGSISQAFTQRRAAVEQNEAQKARNEQIKTALDGIQAEIDRLGPTVWAQKYCIDKTAGQQGLPAGWNCFGPSTATITNR